MRRRKKELMFKGQKTYILMALAVIAAWGTYLAGDMTLGEAITATFGALGGVTLRSGVTTEVKKLAGCLAFVLTAFALTACQTAPQVAAQTAKLDSGAPLSAPVDQARSFVYAPTYIVGSGSGISGATRIGPDASGDLKAAESLRSGLTGGAQTSTPTQTVSVDPKAVAEAAGKLLESVSPTGAAAGLAGQAMAEAKTGSPSKAAELLAQATAAAAKEKGATPPAPPEEGKPVPPAPSPAPAPTTNPPPSPLPGGGGTRDPRASSPPAVPAATLNGSPPAAPTKNEETKPADAATTPAK